MKINSLEAKKTKINKKDTILVKIKSSNGKFESVLGFDSNNYTKENLDSDIKTINSIINKELKNKEMNSFEDLSQINPILESKQLTINNLSLITLQSVILKAISKNSVYDYFDKDINIIPRPLGIVLGNSQNKRSNDFKEYLIFCTGTNRFEKSLNAISRVQEIFEKEVKKYDKTYNHELNEQNAIVADINIFDTLDLLTRICKEISTEYEVKLSIGINVSAKDIYQNDSYIYNNYLPNDKQKTMNPDENLEFIMGLVKKYDLFYIEDPLINNDIEGYKKLRKNLKCFIISNFSFDGSLESIKNIVDDKYFDAVVLNSDKITSLTKLKEVIDYASSNNIKIIAETPINIANDNFFPQLITSINVNVLKYGIYQKDKIILNEIKKIEQNIKEKRKS